MLEFVALLWIACLNKKTISMIEVDLHQVGLQQAIQYNHGGMPTYASFGAMFPLHVK